MLHFKAEDDESKYQIKDCKSWFGDSDEVKNHHEYAPGRIKALISLKHPNEIDNVEEDVYAVMETCEFKHKKSSLFTTKWVSVSMYLGGGGETKEGNNS